MCRPRLLRLLSLLALLLGVGLGYAAFLRVTGLFIPCVFRSVTGLLCPGCGISHMCLALLRLDFADAWSANPGLLIILPVLAVLLLRAAVHYVRSGSRTLSAVDQGLVWLMVIWLLLWGVIRNLA